MKNLRKKYKQLFEGKTRSNDSTLTEAPMTNAFPRMRTAAEKRAAGVVDRPSGRSSDDEPTFPEPIDIQYWVDQLNTILESVDDFHQELGTEIQMKAEETGNYEYETMEKQISRYINGAQKQLEGLQKYIDRQKSKGL